jgi:hypothetical protein
MAGVSDAITGQLIVAGTALLSGSLGLAGGIVIEHLRTRRDQAARREARQDQRDDFQRQTLLEVQEAIAQFVEAVGRIHRSDGAAHTATGTWSRTRFTTDSNDEFLARLVRLQLANERVRDDELRRLVTGFQNRGVIVTTAASQEEATQRMDDWIERLGEVQDRLGMVLRHFV